MNTRTAFAASALIVAGYTGGLSAVVHFTDAEVRQQQADSEEGRYGCTEGKTRTPAGCRRHPIPNPPVGSYVGWDLTPR